MISRYSVSLGNVSLAGLDENIYVSDISYQAASPSRSTNQIAARDGQYSGENEHFSEAKVAVTFMARAYDTADRQEIIQKVAAWAAGGGWLTTSDRPGQRLYVVCTRYPAVTSVMRWTENLSLEFTAFDYPFWTDTTATEVTLTSSGSKATKTLTLGGVRNSFVEATVTAGAAITTLEFGCGSTAIKLTGLSIANEETVRIRYENKHHTLWIHKGDYFSNATSLMDKRTTDSSDDLVAAVGANTVTFKANASASCVFRGRGVYL